MAACFFLVFGWALGNNRRLLFYEHSVYGLPSHRGSLNIRPVSGSHVGLAAGVVGEYVFSMVRDQVEDE
jgi:hypothetical protein